MDDSDRTPSRLKLETKKYREGFGEAGEQVVQIETDYENILNALPV